ncbi:hypothetical protein [Allomesorhizobium alhagi]|uniref:hypothetical protein n=1 Tax=Allomesorhizobium alhagi TaxID=475067 RepID=UPI0002FE6B3E|nr:hypothetical protein [Mesorhizobium alhagi]
MTLAIEALTADVAQAAAFGHSFGELASVSLPGGLGVRSWIGRTRTIPFSCRLCRSPPA